MNRKIALSIVVGFGIFLCPSPGQADISDTNLAREPATNVSSTFSPGFGPERAIDGKINTSWFTAVGDAVNQGGSPFFEIILLGDAKVTELRMFGDRQFNGFDFIAGVFQLFDSTGAELFTSGEVDLPFPTRDITLAIPNVSGVRRVRFTATADESSSPGFAELEVIGQYAAPSVAVPSFDLHPDVFDVVVDPSTAPEEPVEAFFKAFIKPPPGMNAIDITSLTLFVSGTNLGTAESFTIDDNLLEVLFPLNLTNVSAILGIDVVKVKEVDLNRNRIVVVSSAAPTETTYLSELTVFGTLIDGESFSGIDAVRVIPGTPPDTTPPIIEDVMVSPNVLWPANHRMVPVTVEVSVSDDSDDVPACQIITVSSNEPVKWLPDWKITGDLMVDLRAERSRKGSGRVYMIGIQCTDSSGNNAIETVTVTVPHDQGKRKFKKFKSMWKKYHRRK